MTKIRFGVLGASMRNAMSLDFARRNGCRLGPVRVDARLAGRRLAVTGGLFWRSRAVIADIGPAPTRVYLSAVESSRRR